MTDLRVDYSAYGLDGNMIQVNTIMKLMGRTHLFTNHRQQNQGLALEDWEVYLGQIKVRPSFHRRQKKNRICYVRGDINWKYK